MLLPIHDINTGDPESGVPFDRYPDALDAILARYGGGYPSGVFGTWLSIAYMTEVFDDNQLIERNNVQP